ncbi:zinc finger MYM-type protein 1-like [Palaemon carinicauda]|uniref:zinc finger MYM-type protein 1-like n=1 Tax=Palaemon carinicauda TaxID=392227 RepID=UPI0035B5E139
MHYGLRDWKNLSSLLSSHEKVPDHLDNVGKWKELEQRLKKHKTIDDETWCARERVENYWQQILERLIALVRVLGVQNLSFRGTNEKLCSAGNGNFLKFVELMALFDPVMSEHLQKIRNEETHVHYLGKNFQNELIDILANAIKEKILRNARAAKYFSIILDSTPDVSHVEQMPVIIRFVQVDEDNAVIAVREHFLGYVPLQETTGAFMAETILEEFKKMDLFIDNLRGQGYDNGINMKGKHSGVQKKILQRNPRALFVPCSAHTLNLVVNDAASCCLEATIFFGLIQKLYVFFSASTHRWDVLKRRVQSLTVKPLSETRGESQIDALKPIRYQIGDIYDALTEMATNFTLLGSSGNSTRAEAKALANGIATFKFLVSLIVWKKKRQFDYEEDTPVQNAKVNFKVNFYLAVLDVAINSGLERFQQLQQMKSAFGFLYDVKPLNGITNTQLMEHCTKLETALRDGGNKDIDATDLCHELQSVARRLQPDTVTPLDVLKFICEQGLVQSVPNTFVALCILLNLPVTVASGERSFSELKLIRTYLVSTMTEERLAGLAMFSIENEITQKVDLKNLVADFAKKKARKAHF